MAERGGVGGGEGGRKEGRVLGVTIVTVGVSLNPNSLGVGPRERERESACRRPVCSVHSESDPGKVFPTV